MNYDFRICSSTQSMTPFCTDPTHPGTLRVKGAGTLWETGKERTGIGIPKVVEGPGKFFHDIV